MIVRQYNFNLEYATQLVADLTKDQMTQIPTKGLENHPAFTLGHLISGSADLNRDLGGDFSMPDAWADLFIRSGPGDPRKPDPDTEKYPSKNLLLEELENQHTKVVSRLRSMDENELLNSHLKWRFGNFMPSLYDVVIFMCINHEAMHLGQLAAWRRSMGLDSALAKIDHLKKPYH